jgi:curved DNA-binding protein CbpA
MKSCYVILGVPGNASASEIHEAFKKASAHYSKERLVEDPEAATRLRAIQDAYKILSNAEMREAHDRKLSSTSQPPAPRPRVVIEAEPSRISKPLVIMALVVVAMFAIGGYMNHSRDQTRKALAEQELAQKKLEADAEARAAAQAEALQAKQDADRRRAQTDAEKQDRQLRAEATTSARVAANADVQQQALAVRLQDNERREKQRQEAAAKNEERQKSYEAERRVAKDKQTIRDLCMMQYGRSTC